MAKRKINLNGLYLISALVVSTALIIGLQATHVLHGLSSMATLKYISAIIGLLF